MQSWIEGETAPRTYTLYADEGVPQNLTGSTVDLLLTGADGVALTSIGTVAVVSPAAGTVSYTPTAGLLTSGRSPISALFQVTDGGGSVGFYPGEGADTWYVYPARSAFPRLTLRDLRIQVMRWLDTMDDLDQGTGIDLLVKQQLNDASLARASEYPWPFMKATAQLAVSATQKRYTLPGNLGRLLFVWSPTGQRLCVRVPDRMMDDVDLDPAGTHPSGLFMPFEVQGPSLVFTESPPSTELLILGYYRTPSKLLNDSDIPDLPYPHSRLLTWDALLDLKSYAEETQNAPIWIDKQQRAERALYAAYVAGQTLGEVPLSIKMGYEPR